MGRSRKRLPSLPKLKKQCWTVLSEWVRRKNADENGVVRCYTCWRKAHWKFMHAGHFIPGRTGAVLLNPMLIRVQCPRCNIFLHGNYTEFTVRMIDECGRPLVDDLLALKHKVVKWNRTNLTEFLETYRRKLAEL